MSRFFPRVVKKHSSSGIKYTAVCQLIGDTSRD